MPNIVDFVASCSCSWKKSYISCSFQSLTFLGCCSGTSSLSFITKSFIISCSGFSVWNRFFFLLHIHSASYSSVKCSSLVELSSYDAITSSINYTGWNSFFWVNFLPLSKSFFDSTLCLAVNCKLSLLFSILQPSKTLEENNSFVT